ncbi:MAG TPA: DUF3574 domain-containing protein [Longimicrobium sp.]|nr:DUF3574 domain-containing protein [Longimicrobium sp.]
MRPARSFRPAALLAALLLAGCAPAARPAPVPASPAPAGQEWVAERLYLGRGIPGGGTVGDAELDAFVREVVTPRFPDGLTLYHAHGQWRDATGAIVREQTLVVEVLHPGAPGADAALREIAAEYRRRFRQQSVLRVTAPAAVVFH